MILRMFGDFLLLRRAKPRPGIWVAMVRFPLHDAPGFIAKTRFRVVTDPSDADAVLTGNINAAQVYPSIFDPVSGKPTSVQVLVVVSITLSERATGRVLFARNNMAFRQNYSIAVDPHQFFDESGPAFDRVSRDVAHDVVSAIVEAF